MAENASVCRTDAGKWHHKFMLEMATLSRSNRATSMPGVRRRHHRHELTVSKAISAAARRADIRKRVTAHTFRHSFATHLIEAGDDIRTVQELLGHSDVRTTMLSTHVLHQGGRGVHSSVDFDSFDSE